MAMTGRRNPWPDRSRLEPQSLSVVTPLRSIDLGIPDGTRQSDLKPDSPPEVPKRVRACRELQVDMGVDQARHQETNVAQVNFAGIRVSDRRSRHPVPDSLQCGLRQVSTDLGSKCPGGSIQTLSQCRTGAFMVV